MQDRQKKPRLVQYLFDKPGKRNLHMDNAYQQVKKLLHCMEEMQAHHIHTFDTQVMPDLENQMMQRKHLFDQLGNAVNRFLRQPELENDMDTDGMTRYFNDQMDRLLHQNNILAQKVNTHKNQLQESLKNISRGKHAIRSYGSPSSMINRPRAINLTN
jgi:hypothetical protein